MPNPLAAIFNPQPSSYDPRKEQMLASMFGQQQPIRGWGDAIASGLKSIVAARGLNAQGKAREREDTEKQQALAQALGGVSQQLGIPVESLTALADHPLGKQITGELLQRGRPQEAAAPQADPLGKPYSSPLSWVNEAGESRVITTPMEAQQAAGEGFRPAPKEAPAQKERRTAKGVDGRLRYLDTGELTFPDVQAPAPDAAQPDYITATNVTMPDGSVRTVQTRADLQGAIESGGTLPQGGSRQRPLTERQAAGRLAVERMGPAMTDLFGEREDGSTLYEVMANPAQAMLASIPGVGNFLTSEDRQIAENLVRETVSSGLRYVTGAAITEAEVKDEMLRYAPRPGDRPATVERKKKNLQNFMRAIESTVPKAGDSAEVLAEKERMREKLGNEYRSRTQSAAASPTGGGMNDDPLGLFQ